MKGEDILKAVNFYHKEKGIRSTNKAVVETIKETSDVLAFMAEHTSQQRHNSRLMEELITFFQAEAREPLFRTDYNMSDENFEKINVFFTQNGIGVKGGGKPYYMELMRKIRASEPLNLTTEDLNKISEDYLKYREDMRSFSRKVRKFFGWAF